MKYSKTITVYSEIQFDSMKPGQWFQWNNGARGQWLGKTRAGVDYVRYQTGKFGSKSDCAHNALKRFTARLHGAK
ncbi:hypothetical protein bcgnr5398_55510 [Bacillus cereus]